MTPELRARPGKLMVDHMRPPEQLMRLDRMGASFQTRLSFMRNLIRKIHHQKWILQRSVFQLDNEGYGHAIYTVDTGQRIYSLIVFSHQLNPEKRTDRVIAEAWDATFNLFDGVPTKEDIDRLSENTPLQEKGRFTSKELSLGRANKSVRLFSHFIERLTSGKQPDIDVIAKVGYLMRTTAVYGSGKFGCADREKTKDRPEVKASFSVELLAVYLFRWFTLDLVDHVAQAQNIKGTVPLAKSIKRYMGIGNSTGLGMAPFLLKHPNLVHQWVSAKETALLHCRFASYSTPDQAQRFRQKLDKAIAHIHEWNVEDDLQMEAIILLRKEMAGLKSWITEFGWDKDNPWDRIYQHSLETFGLEGQNLTESLIIECNAEIVDDLADTMYAEEDYSIDTSMSVRALGALIHRHYQWALDIDFKDANNIRRFWYYSEEKLEPRFGDREVDPGIEVEMPLAIARDVSLLGDILAKENKDKPLAEFLMHQPQYRHVVRRIQTVAAHPYAEICDNLVSKNTRPLDILRFKLAFFGASKFDPKSNLWTRITMYQGAPLAEEILTIDPEDWAFPVKPKVEGI